MPTPNVLLTAALNYAAKGIKVLPLHSIVNGKCSCRRPCPSPGKHPRLPKGLDQASTAPALIVRWWTRWPAANVGLVPGGFPDGTHLIICDIDNDEERATAQGWNLVPAHRVRTGNGEHWYYRSTAPVRHGKHDGVLVRSAGQGYVVAPPSIHYSGVTYEALDELEPPLISDFPDNEGEEESEATEPEKDINEEAPKGERSEKEYDWIKSCLLAGMTPEQTVEIMMLLPVGQRMRDRGKKWAMSQAKKINTEIRDFDKKYAIGIVGNRFRIIDKDDLNVNLSKEDFLLSLKVPKLKAMAATWMKSANTPVYTGFCFNPAAPNKPIIKTIGNTLNLFKGWIVEPKEGDWSMLEEHIFEHICSRDEGLNKWFLDWFSQMVQFPQVRPTTALVLTSERHGTGKDIIPWFFSRMIHRDHFFKTKTPRELLGQFNSALTDKLLISAEEVMFVGDRKHADQLKGMVSQETINRRQMYVDQMPMDWHARFYFSSNHRNPLYIEPSDRRFTQIQVDDHKHTQDTAYFMQMIKQMEEGGLAAWLYHMGGRDLTGFNGRECYDTVSKRETVAELMPFLDQFICKLLTNPFNMTSSQFHTDYFEAAKAQGERAEGMHAITRRLLALGVPRFQTKGTTRVWNFVDNVELIKTAIVQCYDRDTIARLWDW